MTDHLLEQYHARLLAATEARRFAEAQAQDQWLAETSAAGAEFEIGLAARAEGWRRSLEGSGSEGGESQGQGQISDSLPPPPLGFNAWGIGLECQACGVVGQNTHEVMTRCRKADCAHTQDDEQ